MVTVLLAHFAHGADHRSDGVAVGLGTGGGAVGGALILGAGGYVTGLFTCESKLPSETLCYDFIIGAQVGAVVGASAGALGGAAGMAVAVDRRPVPIVLAGLGALGVGAGVTAIGAAADSDALIVAGFLTGALGAPIAAGVAAGMVPESTNFAFMPGLGVSGMGARMLVKF